MSPTEESVEHLFLTGHIAMEVWSYFGAICGRPLSSPNLRAQLIDWWLAFEQSIVRRFILATLPSFICWNIWKARNKTIFDGVQLRSEGVSQGVFIDVKLALEVEY